MKIFDPKGKNLRIGISKGNFPNPNPNQRWLNQPDPTQVKNFHPDPSPNQRAMQTLNVVVMFELYLKVSTKVGY